MIEESVRSRIDSVHDMIGLKKGQALLCSGHPLYDEYEAVLAEIESPMLFAGPGVKDPIFVSASQFCDYPATKQFVEMLGMLKIIADVLLWSCT